MTTPTDLLAAVLARLEPHTRTVHTYPNGNQHTRSVNDTGFDVHVGQVGTADTFPTGVIRPYAVLWPGPGRTLGNRLTGREHALNWEIPITCVGADDDACMWVLTRVRATLDGARLAPTTGLLRQTSDPGNTRVDDDVRPHRTYVPLTFATRAHGAQPNP